MDQWDKGVGDRGFCFPHLAPVLLDTEGTIVAWSGEAAALLALPAEAVLGRPFDLLCLGSPSTSRKTPALQKTPARGVLDLWHGSRGRIRVSVWGVPLHGEPTVQLVLLAAEEAAAEWGHGVSLLRAILRQNSVGLGIHGADLRLKLTNVTPDMFDGSSIALGQRLADVLPEHDADAIETALRKVMRTGVPVVSQTQRVHRPPERDWAFSLTAFPLQDARGGRDGVAAFVEDVTEQERVQRHRDLLHRAANGIGSSLDVHRTAQELADVVADGLADLVTVDISRAVLAGDEPPMSHGAGDPGLTRAAVAAARGNWPADLLQVGGDLPPMPDSPELRRLQHGSVGVLDRADVERALGGPPLVERLVPAESTSLTVSPLFARGRLLGSVTAWRTARSDPFETSEAELLAEIASRAALGIDNARRYTREHRAATALRERLLPHEQADLRGAEAAGECRAWSGGAAVSGDWFDVIDLPSLRIALVVGDVFGHGLGAAATMGRLRTAVQTYADLELEPS
jgi:PAS domain-containing protein